MIFLALDIDGVLHSVDARTDADDPDLKPFAYLPRLEAVLRAYPDVRVVITSDWQKYHTLEELRAFFSEDLRDRIVGVSGRHPGDVDPGNRQRDVERYFAEQRLQHTVWCAIDDDEQNYLPGAAPALCEDRFREPEECVLRAALDHLADGEIAIEELASAGRLRAPINRHTVMPPDEMTEGELKEASSFVNPDWRREEDEQ